jgi:tRNA threonylcarbamoyladenosine biosynthesis protein TsaE
MATFISHSALETESLGEEWGRTAQPGLVIALSGELGAGKTQLVKGLGRGLGIASRIYSPSFGLVNIYTGGRLELCHLDLYRLDTPEQIVSAGLEQYLTPDGVAVIEWAERLIVRPRRTQTKPGTPPLPCSRLRWVRIENLSEAERQIDYEDFSA